jgi:hypothetical protein
MNSQEVEMTHPALWHPECTYIGVSEGPLRRTRGDVVGSSRGGRSRSLDSMNNGSLTLENHRRYSGRILMTSGPSQRDYLSTLLSGRTDQSYCPDTKSQKEKDAPLNTA